MEEWESDHDVAIAEESSGSEENIDGADDGDHFSDGVDSMLLPFPEICRRLEDDDPTLDTIVTVCRKVGDDGAVRLAGLLEHNTRVVVVDLLAAGIGDSGARALSRILPTNGVIEKLSLNSNSIHDEGARCVGRVLASQDVTLRYLHLSHNWIGAPGGQAIAYGLQENPQSSLLGLILRGNKIGDSGTEALGACLPLLRNLTELDLCRNEIGPVGARALAGGLYNNDSLRHFQLRGNQIGDGGARAFGELFDSSRSKLEYFDVSENNITISGADSIFIGLARDVSLESLNLSFTISARFASSVRLMVCENRTLKSLDLAGNQFDSSSSTILDDLLSGLEHNASLGTLNLSHIHFSHPVSLFPLGNSQSMTDLDLTSCGISDIAANSLFSVLRGNELMKTLVLSNNRLTAACCDNIKSMLLQNHTLESLNLSHNALCGAGVTALAEGLHSNTSLKNLLLASVEMDFDGAKALAAKLPLNRGLQMINLSQNEFRMGHDGIMALIQQGLRYNYSIEEMNFIPSWGAWEDVCKEKEMYESLNERGRRLLQETNVSRESWVDLLHRVGDDLSMTYYVIREDPRLIAG